MEGQITELCKIGYKYGTDKCPQIKHSYTPFYYKLLNEKRNSVKKVLEIGIGNYRNNYHVPEIVYEDGIKKYLNRGASLYMWREFFPNANVFGADNHKSTLFQDERIRTFLCDERSEEDLVRLIEQVGSDIDLVIDDASHHVDDQLFLAQKLMPLLDQGVTYIIEDVGHSKVLSRGLAEYDTYVVDVPRKWHGGMLYVIKHKDYGSE